MWLWLFSQTFGATRQFVLCVRLHNLAAELEREQVRGKARKSEEEGALIAGIAFNWLSLKLKAAAN